MNRLPARAGWAWLKEGFSLFRKQPLEMLTLLMGSLFLMVGVSIIPGVGPVLRIVLMPVLSMAFMQACVQVEEGKRVYPTLLFIGFRSPARVQLLLLGVLYLLTAALAIGASALVDGGVLWKLLTGSPDINEEVVRGSNIRLAVLFAMLVYVPVAMAFWYAAPLIMWQRMGIGKATFYSFFAVKRCALAFLVYAAGWLLVGALLPAMVAVLLGELFGNASVFRLLLLALSLVMTAALYCSFYPTYKHVFGAPTEQAEPSQLPAV